MSKKHGPRPLRQEVEETMAAAGYDRRELTAAQNDRDEVLKLAIEYIRLHTPLDRQDYIINGMFRYGQLCAITRQASDLPDEGGKPGGPDVPDTEFTEPDAVAAMLPAKELAKFRQAMTKFTTVIDEHGRAGDDDKKELAVGRMNLEAAALRMALAFVRQLEKENGQ